LNISFFIYDRKRSPFCEWNSRGKTKEKLDNSLKNKDLLVKNFLWKLFQEVLNSLELR